MCNLISETKQPNPKRTSHSTPFRDYQRSPSITQLSIVNRSYLVLERKMAKDQYLAGQVAIVTGSSKLSGIGAAAAIALAEHGANVRG